MDAATIAVAKVDVPAIKPEAVQAWVTDLMKAAGAKPDELDRAAKGMQEQIVNAKQWQADFAAAGGRMVYLVARMGKEGGGPVGSQLNLVVIPLEPSADTKKLTELIKYPLGLDRPTAPGIAPPANASQKNPLADLKGKTIGKSLVVSDPDTIDGCR